MAVDYEARLRAIGRLLDANHLRSVCVTEVEAGFLVVGLAMTPELGGVELAERTLEFSYDEIDDLCERMQAE